MRPLKGNLIHDSSNFGPRHSMPDLLGGGPCNITELSPYKVIMNSIFISPDVKSLQLPCICLINSKLEILHGLSMYMLSEKFLNLYLNLALIPQNNQTQVVLDYLSTRHKVTSFE